MHGLSASARAVQLMLDRWKFFQSSAPDSHSTATYSNAGVWPRQEIYDQVLVFVAPVLNLVMAEPA